MNIALQGVLIDGSPQGSGIPYNARKALSFVHGQDVTILLTVLTSSGEPIALSTPTSVVLTVKKKPQDSPIFQITADVSGGVASFVITPARTKPLDPGQYIYDVWITRTVGLVQVRDPVIPLSPLYLEAAATPPP